MKTRNELNALKKEFEDLNKRLVELSADELKQVIGGDDQEEVLTYMACDKCPRWANWVGNYVGMVFDCPFCHAPKAYRGIRLVD